jgi:hypothetical protein
MEGPCQIKDWYFTILSSSYIHIGFEKDLYLSEDQLQEKAVVRNV